MAELSNSALTASVNINNNISDTYLIGKVVHQIVGTKLPSNREVLSVFLYHRSCKQQNFNKSLKLVADEVFHFWKKSHVPTTAAKYIMDRLKKLHDEWRKLQKNCKRENDVQKQKEKEFCEKLDNLFDVAHSQALETINNPQVRDFLVQQREKGRPGHMVVILEQTPAVPEKIVQKEERKLKRAEVEQKKKDKYEQTKEKNGNYWIHMHKQSRAERR